MKKLEKQEIVLIFAGIFSVLMGIILNEYVLTGLFSEDGALETPTRLKIWFFDSFFIGLGLLISLSKLVRSVILKLIAIIFRELFSDIKIGSKVLCDLFLTVIILLLLVSQFSHMTSALYNNTDNQGVIYMENPDAGICIHHAKNSKWFIDNSTVGYGPFYFRLAYSLKDFSFSPDKLEEESQESLEKRTHFSLIFISLLALYGISFLIATALIADMQLRLLGVLLVGAGFLDIDKWLEYTFTAHPDLLLSGLVSLFFFFLYKSKVESGEGYLYLGAFVGGAALSTKMTFLFFLPGLIFLELPPFNRDKIIKLIKLYSLILISYFTIGFPQNFFISRNLNFIFDQSQMSVAPTWESFFDWWLLLLKYSWLPFVMIVILFIVFSESQSSNTNRDKSLIWRIWVVTFIPFFFLLTRKIISSYARYTLPHASALLMALAITLPALNWKWLSHLRIWFNNDTMKWSAAVILLLGLYFTIGVVPAKVSHFAHDQVAREVVRTTYKVINSYADKGKKVFVEAYIPYRHGHENIVTSGHLTATLDLFNEHDPDIIAVNVHQMPHIMEGARPSDYMIVGRENYEEIRRYYGLFYNKSETVDPWGRKWIKTYEDLRGVQIWEKT
tara:strand:- start:3433 stop:5277 length:1845 start_codon:yes stop_codon:yes gene_type:complete